MQKCLYLVLYIKYIKDKKIIIFIQQQAKSQNVKQLSSDNRYNFHMKNS